MVSQSRSRFYTFTNSGTLIHGDTSAPPGRYIEVYNNTYTYTAQPTVVCPPDLPPNVSSFINLRGGTMLFHDNAVADINSGMAFGDPPELQFSAWSLRRNAGVAACWIGTGSIGASQYPMPYLTGWGFITGSTSIGGVAQDLEPIYLWNNTGAGNYNTPSPGDYGCGNSDACSLCSSRSLASTFIQSGREYLVNTAKPGYTPFTYPHPLASTTPPPGTPTNLTVN